MSPPDLVALIARLLTPIAGVVFFDWSAPATLVLYFADTLASMAVIGAGLLAAFFPPEDGETIADRINAHAGVAAGGIAMAAVVAIPLGVPLGLMLGMTGLGAALSDPSLRSALVAQTAFALWSYGGLYRALQTATPDELRLKRRFALVFVRWLALVLVAFTGIGLVLGRYAGLAFVACYTAISFVVEVAPERVLRAAGAADLADPPASNAAAVPAVRTMRSRKRRRR